MAKRKKNASFGKKRSEGSAEAYNEKIKEEQKNINKKAALIIFAGFLGLVAFCFLLYFIVSALFGLCLLRIRSLALPTS